MRSTHRKHRGRRPLDIRTDTMRMAHPGGIKCVGVTAEGVLVVQIIPAHYTGGRHNKGGEAYAYSGSRRMHPYQRKAHTFHVSRYER